MIQENKKYYFLILFQVKLTVGLYAVTFIVRYTKMKSMLVIERFRNPLGLHSVV